MIRTIAVVIVLWSSTALAQSATARADQLFRQGRDLMAAGKLAEACSAFEESQTVEPAVTTLLNLAGCREKLGQLATAWALFVDAARQAQSTSDAASQQLHDVAQEHAEKLEPRVSRLTIHVPLKSQVDGLEISRGSERVDAQLWNRAQPIDGGTYTITARAPGAKPWSTQVTVAVENDTKTVEIPDPRSLSQDLDEPAASSRMAVDATSQDPAPVSPRGASNAVPLVVGGGALVLLAGALGLELSARSQYDAALAAPETHRRVSLYDSATTRRYVAEAVAVSGLVAGGTAVWLYLRNRNRERGEVARTTVGVVPMAAGLGVSGRF